MFIIDSNGANHFFNYFLEVIITFFIITLKDDCDFNWRKALRRIIIIIFKKELNKYLFLIISIEIEKIKIIKENKYLSSLLNK